jgi:hypothetical protein
MLKKIILIFKNFDKVKQLIDLILEIIAYFQKDATKKSISEIDLNIQQKMVTIKQIIRDLNV